MKPAARFALGLVACASAACAGPLAGEAAPRQVIVGFVAPTDTAAPATLARLAEIGGAKVAFVAAISASSAAYRLDCPPADPACLRAIAALRAHPTIRYLEADRLKEAR
ncbi:hypothetical protein [Zoogloea sp.]|jgi:hypothetical protein|uniref:hypothetical protein n=1 Tax=Zoogloea sp. TaxID=49181 RepID=UPI0035AD8D06